MKKAPDMAIRRKRSVATDLAAKKTSGIRGGLATDAPASRAIIYNGHAGLGVNQVVSLREGAPSEH